MMKHSLFDKVFLVCGDCHICIGCNIAFCPLNYIFNNQINTINNQITTINNKISSIESRLDSLENNTNG